MMKARGSERILVIDAHRDVLRYYQSLLETQGYTVKTGAFLEISQEQIEDWQPDLIIFDLLVDVKQEQQAWEVLRQLKASAYLASLPLLICAAAFVQTSFAVYLREQDISVLFKPLDTRVLSREIQTLLLRTYT